MLTDSHCHLYYDNLKNNLKEVLIRANELGVDRFICPSTNMKDVQECLMIARKYNNMYCSAGVHPHDTDKVSKNYTSEIFELMNEKLMIAVGEIGLDYFRNISSKETQIKCFREQLKIAQEIKKPVIIHNRNSDKDMARILEEFPEVRGVAHCFSSDIDMAKKFLDLGYYISFSGNLTFKNSHLPEVAKQLPLDRILIETDSPFLSPEPYRGKPNEPARVRFVAEKLAIIFSLPLEKIAEITYENTSAIFRIND